MAPLFETKSPSNPLFVDGTSSHSLLFSATSTVLILSLIFVVFLCGCGGQQEKENELGKKLKKAKKRSAVNSPEKAAESEDEAANEEQAEGEEEPGSGGTSSGKKSPEAKVGVKKKSSLPKAAKKDVKGKKAVLPKKKQEKEEAVAKEAEGNTSAIKGESAVTRAPSVVSGVSKAGESGVTKIPLPKKNDPLYRTMVGAKSNVFDQTKVGKDGDEGYLFVGVTKTTFPKGNDTTLAHGARTVVPQVTMAKGTTEIFDQTRGTQKPGFTTSKVD